MANEDGHGEDHRKEIVVDNLKMAKQLNHLRRNLDETRSDLESTSKRLNDEKKMNEQIAARLENYIKKVKLKIYFDGAADFFVAHKMAHIFLSEKKQTLNFWTIFYF